MGPEMIDDQRDSAPGMSAKELLLELRRDVKEIRSFVDVMRAADLPRRVDSLESTRDRDSGRNAVIAAVVAVALSTAIRLIPS